MTGPSLVSPTPKTALDRLRMQELPLQYLSLASSVYLPSQKIDHIVWGRSLSGKRREEERLHPGFVGLVRLRRVHVAGEEVRFQHSRLGAQQEQRCRSWSVWGLDRQPWEGQPDHSVAG